MSNRVSIAEIGDLDILVGQIAVNTVGAGEISRVQIPSSIPGRNRFFIVESAILYVTDNNVGGTNSSMWPFLLEPAPQADGLGLILPVTSTPVPVLTAIAPAPLAFTINSLGPGVIFRRTGVNAGAGSSLSIWTMDSARRVIVPQGFIFAAHIQDPGDAAAHAVVATLMAQVRWFDLDECKC
jgi:hypothetical protein